MSSWAKPGVKCVCVEPVEALVKGSVYTIERLLWADAWGEMGVVILGYRSPDNKQGGYRLSRFRPLITRTQSQDVELFRSLLTALPVGVEA